MATETNMIATGTEQAVAAPAVAAPPSLEGIPEAVVAPWFDAIYGFNHSGNEPWALFTATGPPPPGVTRPLVAVLDLSGSMVSNQNEMRHVLGELTRDSNAEGKIRTPTPNGGTAMVKACQTLAPRLADSDVVIITDGLENWQSDPITITGNDGVSSLTLDFGAVKGNTPLYLGLVSDYLRYICKFKVYLVGIGNDARQMADSLVTRANCHVALVNRGASVQEIAGTVRAMRAAPTRIAQRQALLPLGAPAPAPEGVIVSVSPEAQAFIDRVTPAEVQSIQQAGDSVTVGVASTALALPPPEMTLDEARAKIVAAEVAMNVDVRFASYDHLKIRAAALLCMVGMIEGRLPAAYFTGQYNGLLTTEPEMKKKLNVLFSALKNQGLLKSMGQTPAKNAGAPLIVDGVKMPPSAVIYKCMAPAVVIATLMEEASFSAPQSTLRKRARPDDEENQPLALTGPAEPLALTYGGDAGASTSAPEAPPEVAATA